MFPSGRHAIRIELKNFISNEFAVVTVRNQIHAHSRDDYPQGTHGFPASQRYRPQREST